MHAPRANPGVPAPLVRHVLVATLVAATAAILLAGPASASRDLTLTIDGPHTSTDNATVDYNVTAHNSGTGAGSNVEVQTYIDGNATAVLHDFGNLADGENGSAVETYTFACGIYLFNGTVDPSDGVPESNETNNDVSFTLVVTPFATFTSNRTGSLGAYTYTFNATASHGCAPLNFTWSIGGATLYGAVVTVSPPAGNMSVALAVRGGSNPLLTGRANETIAVPNAPPTVSATLPADTLPTGSAIGLAVVASDMDGSVASTLITYGDGNEDTTAGAAAAYAYPRSGDFTITVRVTDNMGANATTNVSVHVTNRPPVVYTSFPSKEAQAGTPVEFDASGSSDPDGTGALSITWDFGDGTTGTGPVLNHTYQAPGNYNATVTVTDENGNRQSQTMQIRVTPAPAPVSFPWIWLLLLLLAVVLVAYLVGRRRKEEPAQYPAGKGEDEAKGTSEKPAGEGSSSKPPSP